MDVSLSLPFGLTSYGSIAVSYSDSGVWDSRVKIAVLTAKGERLMAPSYGTNIPNATFESVYDVETSLKENIEESFNLYLEDLELLETNVVVDEESASVSVDIVYKTPTGETLTTVVKRGIINRFGEIVQEL